MFGLFSADEFDEQDQFRSSTPIDDTTQHPRSPSHEDELMGSPSGRGGLSNEEENGKSI